MHPISHIASNSNQSSSGFNCLQPARSSLSRRIDSSITTPLINLSNSGPTYCEHTGITNIKFSSPFNDPDPFDFDALKPIDPMIDILKSLISNGDLNKLKEILSSSEISKNAIEKSIRFAFRKQLLNECILLLQFSHPDSQLIERLFLKEINRGGYLFLHTLGEKIELTPQLLDLSLELALTKRNFFALNFLKPFNFSNSILLEYLISAIQDADYLIAVELYTFKVSDSIRYKAFQEACQLERFSIIENFIQFGASPQFIGDAFLTAVCNHRFSQIEFFSRFSIDCKWVDIALELSAVCGHKTLLKQILLCSPSARGLVKGLINAASFDQEAILDLLLAHTNFSNEQITQAIIIAQDTRSRRAESFLVNYLAIERNLIFEDSLDDEVCWSLEIGLVRKHPEEILKLWYQASRKPMRIIFSDEEGIGDGITRQFYSELVESIVSKTIDEEGLPHNVYLDTPIFGKLASLISFMLENDFKIGKTFSNKWLKVLRMILSSNGFIRFCFVEIYRNIFDSERHKRNLIYCFLNNPTQSTLSVMMQQFSGEAEFMGLDQLSIDDQKVRLRNVLIQKYGDHCLMDFLKLQKDSLLTNFDLDGLAFEIINEIYGEPIKEFKEAIRFSIDIENQFWKKAWNVFKISKTFLNECSPRLIALLQNCSLEEIEGCPLTDIYKIEMLYEGQNEAIKQKIILLRDYLKEKCMKNETDWLQQFVRFFSASLGFTLNKPVGILEIDEECYPQSQTCFYILKLSKGFDQTPDYLPSWQERFLYKLDVAIQQTGFQLA